MIRRLVVSALALVAAVCMRSWGSHLPWQLWIPSGLLAAVAVLIHHRHTGSQLLARAVLWSNLILAVLVAWNGARHELPVAAILGAATGLALLVLGRRGLDDAAGPFVPVAFRATLVALMVMALADAQTLFLFGSMFLSEHARSLGVGAIVVAGGLSLGVLGLYRLRVWGVLAQILGCAGLIGFVLDAHRELPTVLDGAFLASAVLQLVLAAPLIVALAIGGARPVKAVSKGGAVLGAVAVAALTVAAVVPLFCA